MSLAWPLSEYGDHDAEIIAVLILEILSSLRNYAKAN